MVLQDPGAAELMTPEPPGADAAQAEREARGTTPPTARPGEPILVTFDLIPSPSFEREGRRRPEEFWRTDAWKMGPENTQFLITTGDDLPEGSRLRGLRAAHGSYFAYIRNLTSNDARALGLVELRPGMYYRLRARVAAAVSSESVGGATIGIFRGPATAPLRDTGGRWVEQELFFQAGEEQRMAEVALRLGDFGQDVIGEAAFDEVSLVAVTPEDIPANAVVQRMPQVMQPQVAIAKPVTRGEQRRGPAPLALFVGIAAFVFATAATLFLLVRLDRLYERERESATGSGGEE